MYTFCLRNIANIYLAEKVSNWSIEGKKNNILHYCVHREENGRQIKRKWNSAMVRVILNKF